MNKKGRVILMTGGDDGARCTIEYVAHLSRKKDSRKERFH